MRFRPDAPAVLLNVVVVGPEEEIEVDMALDTGATYTMIPWYIAERLGYDPATSPQWAKPVTASGTERVPLITVEAVEVLGLRIPRVEGLLGLSFLRHTNLSIRFKDGRQN